MGCHGLVAPPKRQLPWSSVCRDPPARPAITTRAQPPREAAGEAGHALSPDWLPWGQSWSWGLIWCPYSGTFGHLPALDFPPTHTLVRNSRLENTA